MESELIEKYRKLKKDYILKINKMVAKNERLKLLKQNPDVKEYIELEKECENRELIDMDIDGLIYSSISEEITDTNNIYVCFGKGYSGYYNENGKLTICYPIPKEISIPCSYYINLENWHDGYIIRDEDCEEFEKNHIVIHGLFHEISASSMEKYEMLSKKFISDIINYGNEEAVNRVLKKDN